MCPPHLACHVERAQEKPAAALNVPLKHEDLYLMLRRPAQPDGSSKPSSYGASPKRLLTIISSTYPSADVNPNAPHGVVLFLAQNKSGQRTHKSWSWSRLFCLLHRRPPRTVSITLIFLSSQIFPWFSAVLQAKQPQTTRSPTLCCNTIQMKWQRITRGRQTKHKRCLTKAEHLHWAHSLHTTTTMRRSRMQVPYNRFIFDPVFLVCPRWLRVAMSAGPECVSAADVIVCI